MVVPVLLLLALAGPAVEVLCQLHLLGQVMYLVHPPLRVITVVLALVLVAEEAEAEAEAEA
jgi:hypothetical protein